MGIFDFFKGNNKQKYPTWFDGEKLKEGLTDEMGNLIKEKDLDKY